MGPDPHSLTGAERGPVRLPPQRDMGVLGLEAARASDIDNSHSSGVTFLVPSPVFPALSEVSWPDPFSTGSCYYAPGILSPSGHCSRCSHSLWSLDPDLPVPGLVQMSPLQRPSLASKPQISWASSLFLSGSCHYWKLFLCLPPSPTER